MSTPECGWGSTTFKLLPLDKLEELAAYYRVNGSSSVRAWECGPEGFETISIMAALRTIEDVDRFKIPGSLTKHELEEVRAILRGFSKAYEGELSRVKIRPPDYAQTLYDQIHPPIP